MAGSAIVVNHRVALSGSKARAAVGGSRLLYISNRQGAVALPTDDDLRMRRESEYMEKLGYIAFRPGAVADEGEEHALFDQHGVPARAAVRRELGEAEGAVLTSVVSVRREDADAFHLSTKQDWERLLRAHWVEYARDLGIAEVQNVRWVAAYHVNQRNNLHCHVFTWDSSGRWDSLLAKGRLENARERFVEAALAQRRAELGLIRTQARDRIVERLRAMELPEAQARLLAAALPFEGSLKYACLQESSPCVAVAVDDVVAAACFADEGIERAFAQYRNAAIELARAKSLSGAREAAYLAATEADLRVRAGNAVIANARRSLGFRGLDLEPEVLGADLAAGYELPPTARRRKVERAFLEEASSCLSPEDAASAVVAGVKGESASTAFLRKLPTVRALGLEGERIGETFLGAFRTAASVVDGAIDDGHLSEGAEQAALRAIAFALADAASGAVRAVSGCDRRQRLHCAPALGGEV